jgi:hypothetical protein
LLLLLWFGIERSGWRWAGRWSVRNVVFRFDRVKSGVDRMERIERK